MPFILTFVRSPVAHARILGIDTAAAAAAPGVVAVLTGADLGLASAPPMMPNFNQAMALPPLASDVVRYVGECVAAVLTEQAYQGEDAAGLVSVEYEPLPAVVDMRDAARDDVLLFPESGTNTVCTFGPDDLAEDLFAGCEVVVTQEVHNQRVAVAPMESRAAAVVPDDGGRLTMWLSTQAAQLAKGAVAMWLGLPTEQVRVITPTWAAVSGRRPGPTRSTGWWPRRRGTSGVRCAGRSRVRRTWSGCARAGPRSTQSPSGATGTGRCWPTGSTCCRTAALTPGSARSSRR
jgi:carbon-monoxide dehydrogenase large subunit